MPKVAPPIKVTVTRNAPLRPSRSPTWPNTSAPIGRKANPTPNRARAAKVPAVSFRPAKKVLEMTWVRLPKMKKSYHSNAVPAAEAATTVNIGVARALAPGARSAAISAMNRLPILESSSIAAARDHPPRATNQPFLKPSSALP